MQMNINSDQNNPWRGYSYKSSDSESELNKKNHKSKKMKLINDFKDIAKILVSFEDFSQRNYDTNKKSNFNESDLGIEIREMLKKEVLNLHQK
jgi:hypothetical protein